MRSNLGKNLVNRGSLAQPKISVILNVFKRSRTFELQLSSIQEQSIKPIEVLVWENGEEAVPKKNQNNLKVSRSNFNFGVWARFAYALNAKGDYICVLDDDTIPGSRWLENCYATIIKSPGLLGTRGLIFESPLAYSIYREVGLYGNNELITQVDIVGHSWFFKKEWLAGYWSELNNKFQDHLAGEDIHFSFVMQKHYGLPTLVPPHPKNQPQMWGSNFEFSKKLGGGPESISKSPESLKRFERALQHYRKIGFSVLSENSQIKSRYPKIVYFLIQKFPSQMHYFARISKIVRRK
jgi:glycosyltransferase involved in cell wall biosynthesis